MYKYPVIIFEGIEASGKSTNLENVSKFLNKINRRFVKIREPGGSKNSEKIRKLILDKNSTFNKKTDLLLLLASRSENIEIAGRKLCSNILNIYGKEMAGSPLLPPTRGKMGR